MHKKKKHSSTIFFFQAEDGIRDLTVTGVQTCALPIWCDAALGGNRHQRQRRRAAAVNDSAHRDHDRALSQETAARFTEASGGADRGQSARIRSEEGRVGEEG